ncbi:MAG TPA: hypothetical protein DEG17_19200 [Cyanobacteria bacterium UBA11149]|nr:hypothetical protein [Cyanobacteria bacterium UBA11367]HBE57917.1 hypothetical protein [Cyanobacteria bacterium UBA11366]HBK66463.1 hypothetical protein [Cyanobacteria bacterium UBA11166]HBR74828.1 hypothetical protein [Cyanobacteria bacterium UBA11159]HBS69089.1 hypothetical protein [Cyanobacteria bacterium UBA11153]HBW90936.1 hypothetical protein [Cyanobacteria bacterium UBA11149]HCA95070.1 hypothetical protein [Cyanobacteria bacterium UBA9226]
MTLQSSSTLTILKPDGGTKLSVLGDILTCKATVETTDNNWELFELSGLGKSGPPLHTHPWDEAYYILEGEVEVQVGEKIMTTTPGYFINIPGQTPHTYNIQSETAKFLVLVSSPEARHFFEEIDNKIKSLPPDMEEVMNIAQKHNVIPT